MASRNNEPSQGVGDGGTPQPPAGPTPDQAAASRAGNKVFKSGPLFISSKGIGWTSWKKRWFILTRTSLVFFRSDPSVIPQKGSEVNLTLGGIDLNNSGSVVVKADKKLLTVLFPDGRDGRAFTLKAETLEDLYEWKTALENALSQAPSATLMMGQNGILRNDQAGATDGSVEQLKDKQTAKSKVIGRPVLLALEEVDGSPSFLEKALRFIEEHGIKVEGILRQAADVDDVEHRIREYEQGKTEFSPEEDAHVIADCIKYVIRELPSSPVPASCCNALLEACKTDREHRVNSMRTAICETFPEPNRRLLQRILIMMQTIASHKAVNRMSSSAVAACMAPLLLRPLLAGDCELEHDFDVGGDNSVQLLQAAAAANHAQAIVITLLEEYNSIFGEGSLSPGLYSDTEEAGSGSGEGTDDEYYEDEDEEDEEDEEDGEDEEEEEEEEEEDATEESGVDTDDDTGNISDGSLRSVDDGGRLHVNKVDHDGSSSTSSSKSPEAVDYLKEEDMLSPSLVPMPSSENDKVKMIENSTSHQRNNNLQEHSSKSAEALKSNPTEVSQIQKSAINNSSSAMQKSTTIAAGAIDSARRTAEALGAISMEVDQIEGSAGNSSTSTMHKSTTIAAGTITSVRRTAVWGRTPAKKNLSMESIDLGMEEEEIERLEVAKTDLESKIAEETRENEVLLATLESQKKALLERRQALEKDVARLQEQLQNERDLRKALEAGLQEPHRPVPYAATVDEKVRADLQKLAAEEAVIGNLRLMVDDIGVQLNKQKEENNLYRRDSGNLPQQSRDDPARVTGKQTETKSTSISQPVEMCSKDYILEGKQTDNERKQESSSSINKQQPSGQQMDSVGRSKSRHNRQSINAQAAEPATGTALAPMSSKRSGTRSEGAITTATALKKLTNRLNFLKERHAQIANELSNMDKAQGSGRGIQSPEKTRGIEGQATKGPGKAADSASCGPSPSSEVKVGGEDKSPKAEKYRKSRSQDPNRGRVTEGQASQNVERNQESVPPSRTQSR